MGRHPLEVIRRRPIHIHWSHLQNDHNGLWHNTRYSHLASRQRRKPNNQKILARCRQRFVQILQKGSSVMSGATAQDFAKWEDHAKSVDYHALVFIIQDCRNAREAMKGWNPEKENFYADQGMTYSDELRRRMK